MRDCIALDDVGAWSIACLLARREDPVLREHLASSGRPVAEMLRVVSWASTVLNGHLLWDEGELLFAAHLHHRRGGGAAERDAMVRTIFRHTKVHE